MNGTKFTIKDANYITHSLVFILMMLFIIPAFGQLELNRRLTNIKRQVSTNENFDATAAISITPTTNLTTLQNALTVTGTGITVTSMNYIGAGTAAGTFNMGPFGIADGIILATGEVTNALPPDDSPNTSTNFNLPGDLLCDGIIGGTFPTFDAARLEIVFDVDATTNGISFQFVFGSEEYPEYVGSEFNDVFGAFLNGTQVAFDNDGHSITINGGFFSSTNVVTPPANDMEYDGSTSLLQTQVSVTPGSTGNTLIFVICDVSDRVLDSGVLLASFQGNKPPPDTCTGFPPKLTCPDSLMAFPGVEVTFPVTASDPDTELVTLDVEGLPDGATMEPGLPSDGNPVESNFSWVPNNDQVGEHTVTYFATDTCGLSVSCEVVVTVKETALLCDITPATSFKVKPGETVTFDVTGKSDNPDETVTIALFPGTSLPAGATMTPTLPTSAAGSVTSTFSWTTGKDDLGAYLVSFIVTDSQGNRTFCKADIEVEPTPPQCEITPNDTFCVFIGSSLTFDVTATDMDPVDTALVLDFAPGSGLPPGATMTPPLPAQGPSPLTSTFNWTPTVDDVGMYTITYQVTDCFDLTSTCSVKIQVKCDSIPPVCLPLSIDPGPPFVIEAPVQDTQTGIAYMVVLAADNANVEIPKGSGLFYTVGDTVFFDPPEMGEVVIRATKMNEEQSATVVVEVFDVCGNSALCDPVYTTLSSAPRDFKLLQNYPNPFNPSTTINFALADGSRNVTLRIYDITGRLVKTLVNTRMEGGEYAVVWNGTNDHGDKVAGGVYLYRLVAGDYVATRKMTFMK